MGIWGNFFVFYGNNFQPLTLVWHIWLIIAIDLNENALISA
jgi:hypothetical protein